MVLSASDIDEALSEIPQNELADFGLKNDHPVQQERHRRIRDLMKNLDKAA